jgi:zinc protease
MLLLVVFQVAYSEAVFAEVEYNKELFEKLAVNKNKVPHIDIPEYKRVKYENGLIVYLVEDHQLPIVEIKGYINGGRRQEVKELAGISSFMVEMMNTGTKHFNEKELANYKDINGIDFGFGVENDYLSFGGSALSTDTKELISLMAEIFKNPKFNANHFTRVKQELYRSLAQAKTQEGSLLDMYFYKNIYNNHPYSFDDNIDLNIAALSNITPKSLQSFYDKNISPSNTIFAVVGDIDTKKMEKMLQEYFNDWGMVEEEERQDSTKDKQVKEEKESKYQDIEVEIKNPLVKMERENYGKVILVNKPDATQAKIKMGYNFFDNSFENRIALTMANRVYGGGDFESRLMDNLRTEKGFVYGIYANDTYNQLGGVYYISTEVKPENTYQAIEAIKEEMTLIKSGEKKIKEGELFKIINLYNAFYPKSYKSKLNVINRVIYNVELQDRDADYINKVIEEYNHLSASKAQEVFAKYTYPKRFLTVIVGKKEDILAQFEEQGINVEVVEIK